MPMDDDAQRIALTKAAHATLERIAKTLGCSVEDFMVTEGASLASHGLEELMAIWSALENGRDRNQLLAFARGLVVQ